MSWTLSGGQGGVDGVCSDWDHQQWDVTSLIWADRQLQQRTAALTTIALNRYWRLEIKYNILIL